MNRGVILYMVESTGEDRAVLADWGIPGETEMYRKGKLQK